ncbi:MAG: VOC family protein [Clostridia bacterium]|nr:VOC family protein [Clostridia bacterium]
MRINKVHHIAIICSDYQRSKHFYVDLLGFTVLLETYREERKSYKLDLAVGDNCQIELFSFENPPERITNPEARGLRHLAFEVDDIEESVKILMNHGIEIEPVRFDETTGKRFTFFRDPDRLPLELYER